MMSSFRFNDDRSSLRKQKMTTNLNESVLIYSHTGPVLLEEAEQILFISWFDLAHPKLSLSLFHVPNETQGKVGKNKKLTGGALNHQKRLTKKGRRKGASDLILGLPSKHFPYAVIEFKAKTGSTDDDQIKFLNHHSSLGALCVVVRGFEAAKRFMNEYLQYV